MTSLNLWDLALDKKRKSETQRFSLAQDRKSVGFPPRTKHSLTVANNAKIKKCSSKNSIFFKKIGLLIEKTHRFTTILPNLKIKKGN